MISQEKQTQQCWVGVLALRSQLRTNDNTTTFTATMKSKGGKTMNNPKIRALLIDSVSKQSVKSNVINLEISDVVIM